MKGLKYGEVEGLLPTQVIGRSWRLLRQLMLNFERDIGLHSTGASPESTGPFTVYADSRPLCSESDIRSPDLCDPLIRCHARVSTLFTGVITDL